MDVKIKDRDIVTKACGDAMYIDDIDEILQRVKIACTVKKGSFVYDRSLGSFAHTLSFSDEMLSEKLEMIYKEATIDIPYTDLKVQSVNSDTKTAILKITCGKNIATVEVTINE